MKPETMNNKLYQMNEKLQSISHNVPEEAPEPYGSFSYTGDKQPPAIAPADNPGYFGISYNKPKSLLGTSTKYNPEISLRQEVRRGLQVLGMPAAVFLLITFVFREINSDFQAAAFVITLAAWVGFWLTRFDDTTDDKYKHKYKDWEYEAIIYKRELAAWQVNKALMQPMPIDTSWGGMSEEEQARLEYFRLTAQEYEK